MDDYLLLKTDERDVMLVQTYLAQERDLFMHRSNLERYEAMLTDPAAPKEYVARIATLAEETRSRIAEVEIILRATKPQLPDEKAMAVASETIAAREAIASGTPQG